MLHPLFISVAPLHPRTSKVATCHRRRYVYMAKKSAPPPPVKSSFYKNPSKAIEKGGGFYIPGLRGPRLRYFVSAVSATLLTLNHVASPHVKTPTLTISECLTAVAVLAVFATALVDTFTESISNENRKADKPSVTTTKATNVLNNTAAEGDDGQRSQVYNQAADKWALASCISLTPVTHIAAFRSGELIIATDNVDTSLSPGPIIQRVQQEARAFYIADTSELPPDVTLPFFGDGPWSAYVVPVEDGAVAFAVPAGGIGLLAADRRWLGAVAPRLVGSLLPSSALQ